LTSRSPDHALVDDIELKIQDWLEHLEQELKKLREERERERRERLATARREAYEHAQWLAGFPQDSQERQHSPSSSLATLVRG
jgi:demethoxyubiquinone hydroxylase (CLK1/Coq7/Cat5 family)